MYMACSTVKCTSTNVTLATFSYFPYFLPKYRNNINQGYNYCFTYIHIAQTVWISQSNKFLNAKLNHMNILSNQWPQKSRLLPHVNKNDFCSLFSVKMYFLAHLWGAYAIPVALSVVRRESSVVCRLCPP